MPNCIVSVYLDYECLQRIDAAAGKRGVKRAQIVRELLEAAFPAEPAESASGASQGLPDAKDEP